MIEFIDKDVQHLYDDLVQREDELRSEWDDIDNRIRELIANNEKE